MANIFSKKHAIANRVMALEATMGPLLQSPEISQTLVHKQLKNTAFNVPALREYWMLLLCQPS